MREAPHLPDKFNDAVLMMACPAFRWPGILVPELRCSEVPYGRIDPARVEPRGRSPSLAPSEVPRSTRRTWQQIRMIVILLISVITDNMPTDKDAPRTRSSLRVRRRVSRRACSVRSCAEAIDYSSIQSIRWIADPNRAVIRQVVPNGSFLTSK